MMMSPLSIFSINVSIVEFVGAPAGTITQTIFGEGNFDNMSSMSVAPSTAGEYSVASRTNSGFKSNATTSWPLSTEFFTKFKPILPRPIIANFMVYIPLMFFVFLLHSYYMKIFYTLQANDCKKFSFLV